LYNDYYNSGFASTPITGLPNFAAVSPNSSTFAYNVTGKPTDPQQYTSDTYCGGVFHGYLYTTISYGVYIVGVQSKDGFALTLANSTIGSNSEFVIQHFSVQDSSCEMQFVHTLSHSGWLVIFSGTGTTGSSLQGSCYYLSAGWHAISGMQNKCGVADLICTLLQPKVDFTAMLMVLQCNGSATQEAVWWDCIGPPTQILLSSTVPLVVVSVVEPYSTLHSLWAMSQAVGLHMTDNVVAYMQEVVRS